MPFTVITTAETKLVEPSQVETRKGGVDSTPANVTIKKRMSGEDEIAASATLTVAADMSAFSAVKGFAMSSDNPLTVQVVGGANPGMANVSELHMRGEITSLIFVNNGTEAATVEWVIYGDPA
jgi:hypothetical protein